MKAFLGNNAARLAVLSNAITWSLSPMAWADVDGVIGDTAVHEEGIFISLPVYIISIVATAGFTWTIAKYDSQRIRRLEGLEHELKRANSRALALETRIEELIEQTINKKGGR